MLHHSHHYQRINTWTHQHNIFSCAGIQGHTNGSNTSIQRINRQQRVANTPSTRPKKPTDEYASLVQSNHTLSDRYPILVRKSHSLCLWREIVVTLCQWVRVVNFEVNFQMDQISRCSVVLRGNLFRWVLRTKMRLPKFLLYLTFSASCGRTRGDKCHSRKWDTLPQRWCISLSIWHRSSLCLSLCWIPFICVSGRAKHGKTAVSVDSVYRFASGFYTDNSFP